MSQKLVALNPDLKRLRDAGFCVDVKSGFLVVDRIPYVSTRREVKWGALVSELTLAGNRTQRPSTHVIYFVGDHPCDKNGRPIAAIVNASNRTQLAEGLWVDHTFSSKPATGGYVDYFEKVRTYANIISNEATALNPDARPDAFAPIAETDEDSVFNYLDTASSRIGIGMANAKLALARIAIIGCGGTGSYVLDLVAKTPVKEIHLFDGDRFLQHNAFRAPGAPTLDELMAAPLKVDYFSKKYSCMRRGIVAHPTHASMADADTLSGMDFVFLCMDTGPDKLALSQALERARVPFVDTGIGLELAEDVVTGIVRVTASTPADRGTFQKTVSFAKNDEPAEYGRNIQIADLNALNAALAVVKWKKLFRFYFDGAPEANSIYLLGANELLNESVGA